MNMLRRPYPCPFRLRIISATLEVAIFICKGNGISVKLLRISLKAILDSVGDFRLRSWRFPGIALHGNVEVYLSTGS
jgi:hypothetical protein